MNRFVWKIMLLLWMLPGLALAQGSDSTEPASKPTTNTPSNFSVTRTLSGRISSISAGAKQLVVKDSTGKLHTLKVADETKYQEGTKNLGLEDLHDGQKVKVTYRAADSTALEVRLAQARPQQH